MSAGFTLSLTLSLAMSAGCGTASAADPPVPQSVSQSVNFAVVGDAIPEPLTTVPPDAARGKSLVVAREAANCVLCHAVPDPAVRFSGDVGPSLAGVGARLTVPQLRLRVADNMRLHPATIMPSYYRVEGLAGVAAVYRGKPILSARDVEDVVAYLAAMR